MRVGPLSVSTPVAIALVIAIFLFVFPIPLKAAEAPADPGDAAYAALRAGDLDKAVEMFRQAVAARPEAVHLHKDLAYTLLKTGERESARDEFAAALKLNPSDETSALEYGFLCYETKRPIEARRIFLKWKEMGTDKTRATAASAFDNVDRPLAEGIARWKAAVAAAPDQWTAHEELARLAELRDELPLAAEHYEWAMRHRPGERRLMLDLARVWQQMGRTREAMALTLAASRSIEPRIAESAKELLPPRYPFPYEFEDALTVDPENGDLRREYAFLLLAMGKRSEARAQFELQLKKHPNDRLSAEQLRLLQGAAPTGNALGVRPGAPDAITAKELGLKSYHRGYLQDALRYLESAWEDRPGDAEVALQLAWTLNLLKRDREALEWFDRARQSNVVEIAREADHAYRNLAAAHRRFRLTVWALPMYSSRWDTTFAYSQAKVDLMQFKHWGIQPYVSLRWMGDSRLRAMMPGSSSMAMLSDSAFITSFGANRYLARGLFVWGEVGRAFSYLSDNPASGLGQTDVRGGASFLRNWGNAALTAEPGWFTEVGADAVYVSRYNNNFLVYSQTRRGYTLDPIHNSFHLQPYWNFNVTTDVQRQWWGNTAETGPGVRLRWDALPPNMSFRADFVRGVYLINKDNPHRPNFWDLRASLWYAITR